MPRGPRLDAPGVVHHVMVRGLEQRESFQTHEDRADFVRRLSGILPDTQTACLAWCVLPNHAHLALRSGPKGLSHLMRRLLTGYAVAFNHRHGRAGHLFQNRYQSIVCEEQPYLPALVRYVHLNPIRAGIVAGLKALEDYSWCGHGALMGRVSHPWQDTAGVLARFGDTPEHARSEYAAFVAAEPDVHDEPRAQSETAGRLAASAIAAELPLRPVGADPHGAWGSPEFVDSLRGRAARGSEEATVSCRSVVEAVCRALGLSPHALASGRRTRPLSNGRAVVAYVARTRYRISGTELADALGMTPPAVTFAERRGAQLLKRRLDLRAGLQELLR